jgi:replication initiator protein RepSA
VFATLTAPSFGPVHSARRRNGRLLPCRPRRDANQRRCPHGRDISCGQRHEDDDPRLGRPLCEDCYDYQGAVLFNACAGELWRRFTTYLPRQLARLLGITQKQLRKQVTVRYVKVAEYQLRGVVHFHAVIRLDARGEGYQPPPPGYTANLLCEAIRQAATAVRLVLGPEPGHPDIPALRLGFGAQTDPRPIRHHNSTGQQLTAPAVANYITKYATKTLTAPGLPGQRLRDSAAIEALSCSWHYQRMIATAWRLGRLAACGEQLRRWAHMLGFGGHFLTKSRRYSVTFGQLRKARTEHRRAHHHPDGERDPWGRPLDDTVVLVVGTWTVTGIGYTTNAEADLAMAAAARARDHDRPPQAA